MKINLDRYNFGLIASCRFTTSSKAVVFARSTEATGRLDTMRKAADSIKLR